jgi:hypothetical protein
LNQNTLKLRAIKDISIIVGKNMIEKSNIIKKLEEYFTAKDEVILAYLFGSVAKGEFNRLSDVDVAVLLDENLTKQEMFDLELKIIDDIVGILKIDDIDLTIMNLAPLILNYNIIKQGYILESDENKRVRFETYLMSRYLDEKYYRKRHMRESLKKMIEVRENE